MGFKEKMFENMMGKMSAEEKNQMMQGMMNKLFENMSADEKKEMMNTMMPKMMPGMMDGKGFSMMDMMKNMMGGMMGSKKDGPEQSDGPMGFNPMEMCKKMMSNIEKTNDLATFATPEVRALFEEWAEQIENEILDYIKANDNADPEKIAEKFKLSKDSVNFFITKLSQKGKININAKAK
jgi:hypothetical protein